jgi:hypothetical protein
MRKTVLAAALCGMVIIAGFGCQKNSGLDENGQPMPAAINKTDMDAHIQALKSNTKIPDAMRAEQLGVAQMQINQRAYYVKQHPGTSLYTTP